MKRFKERLFCIFTGFCIGITPYIFMMADIERGYADSFGGEVFIPFLPPLVWVIHKTCKDWKEAMREQKNREIAQRRYNLLMMKKREESMPANYTYLDTAHVKNVAAIGQTLDRKV